MYLYYLFHNDMHGLLVFHTKLPDMAGLELVNSLKIILVYQTQDLAKNFILPSKIAVLISLISISICFQKITEIWFRLAIFSTIFSLSKT